MTDEETTLPEVDVADAKRVLAASIGRELVAVGAGLREAATSLDALRRSAGFVNGLSDATSGAKRLIEEAARVLAAEVESVRRALSQKPEAVSSVDAAQTEAVLQQRHLEGR